MTEFLPNKNRLAGKRLVNVFNQVLLPALITLLFMTSLVATQGESKVMSALAFAGADGYGANTVGGRGGTVLHVTNLNDSGIGSLRWALEQVSGPRIVVFDVGGTINLKSQILIEHGNVTVAGQSAPGEGVTLSGAGIRVKTSEVIIRGMHIRPGDGAAGSTPDNRDALMVGTTEFEIKNVAIDHNSFAWAVDENVALNGRLKDISFTNNIVAEGLSNSLHSKGEHSKGLLVSNWGGTEVDTARISIARNLFSDNMQRNPEVRAGQQIEIINNLIYNYGLGHIGMALGGANEGTITVDIDVLGNVLTPGADTAKSSKGPIFLNAMSNASTISLSDNLVSGRAMDANGNQVQASLTNSYGGVKQGQVDNAAASKSGIAVLDSSIVSSAVLGSVGAVNGSGADTVDRRVLNEVLTRTGSIIDKVSEVQTGGASVTSYGAVDSDRDGMPDWFEDLYGFDKAVANDKADSDLDGYTNVEEYLNGIISGFDLGGSRLAATKVNIASGGTVTASALATPVAVTGFASGSQIDLSAVVTPFNTATDPLSRYVEIAYANGNSYVSVDADGAGAGTSRTLVVVVEKARVTLADLKVSFSSEAIAKAPTPAPVEQAEQAPVGDSDFRLISLVQLIGTAGNDTHTIRESHERVSEKAGGGTDTVVSFVDYALDAHVENLSLRPTASTGTGNDLGNRIVGNDGANWLAGLDGNDVLSGKGGHDRILGGNGDDRIEGNDGNDVMSGGFGADFLLGGFGDDTFIFESAEAIATRSVMQDRINDFSQGDRIFVDGALVDFTSVDSIIMPGATQAKAWDAASKIIATGDDFALIHGARDSWLFWDGNDDGVIDSGVLLANAATSHQSWMNTTLSSVLPEL